MKLSLEIHQVLECFRASSEVLSSIRELPDGQMEQALAQYVSDLLANTLVALIPVPGSVQGSALEGPDGTFHLLVYAQIREQPESVLNELIANLQPHLAKRAEARVGFLGKYGVLRDAETGIDADVFRRGGEMKTRSLLAIHSFARGDMECRKMLLRMERGFPGESAFLTWLQSASHLGLAGPQLVTMRTELGSDRELICTLLAKIAKRSGNPMIMLAMTAQIEAIRSRMTW